MDYAVKDNMKRCNSCLSLMCQVFLVVFLAGCSRHAEVSQIGFVPDSAVSVRAIDFRKLLKDAGVRAGSFKAANDSSVAQRVVDLIVEPDFRDAFRAWVTAGEGVDLSRFMEFTTHDGNDVIVCPVADEIRVVSELDASGFMEKFKDGERFVDCGRCVAVFHSGYCFLAREMHVIERALADARESHFGTLAGVRGFLDGPGTAKLAVNCHRSPLSFLGGEDKWLCIKFNVTDISASAEGMVMDRDGKLDSIGRNFREIDPDFLRYTPADASVVLAFGKFKGNERGLAMLLGRFAPVYLSQADGTTSLYALPASGNASAVADAVPGSWNVETMVHVPEDVLSEGIGQYLEKAPDARDIGSQWCYEDGDAIYYFGAFDGNLVFSTNREISSDYSNAFMEDFEGKRAAMLVDIPAGSVLARAWRIPYGLTFKMSLNTMSVKARISFSGAEGSALECLLSLPQLPDIKARFDADLGR